MSDHSGPLDDLDEIHDNFDDDFGDEHAYDDAASDDPPAAGDVLEVCCDVKTALTDVKRGFFRLQ